MKFTYYGQSCFAIEVAGKKLLFDPFISGNPLAQHIDINTIEADYILASHGHGDHVADLVPIAKRTGATVIGMYEVVEWAMKQGVEKGHHMNFGPYRFDFGTVRMVPAAHSSCMPDGSNGGVAGGFVVTTEAGNFYFAGDTCLMLDMQLIPKYYAQLHFSVLPVGGNFTMDAQDALIAADFIGCDKIIGVHFDTFEPIKIDHAAAKDIFSGAGKELILPKVGDVLEL
jgi:L-ascorbate metabolism protein UlaG (beta-lactamase superfamily)